MATKSPAERLGVLLFVLVSGSSWLWLASSPAAAAGISISASPEQVNLVPSSTAAGTVSVTNSDAAQAVVAIRWVPSDQSVQVDMPKTAARLTAGSSAVFDFQVTRVAEGSGLDSAVSFIATSPRGAATTTVTIKVAAHPVLLEAKVDSAVERIDENRPGAASLAVNNPRDTPVKVESVAVSAPSSTTVTVRCPSGPDIRAEGGTTTRAATCAFTVPPREQQLLPITFSATELVTPGARSLSFVVHASDGHGSAASVIASTSFSLEVFGESEILQAVGVPVFLVLPGVVAVLAAYVLVRRFSPWRSAFTAQESHVGVVSQTAVTGILGVVISLLLAALYPWLTGNLFPGRQRDYRHAYGFLDFYYVLAYGFLLGATAWLLTLLAYASRFCWRALLLPQPGDPPRALLRKLGTQGFFTGRSAVFLRVEFAGMGAVLLSEQRNGTVLVAPRIVVDARPSGGAPDKACIEQISGNGAWELWQELRLHRREDLLRYKPGDVVTVAEVPKEGTTPSASKVPLIEAAPGS
ncbi:hypothetical protein ACIOD2_49490 [Amycolatopsis sp. NPDC088138]|uniref:hypothetical protein n=1 Tax=Amycolatopsis sp. NPDC088138 TaxID=3363938 RepID=UPI0037FD967B